MFCRFPARLFDEPVLQPGRPGAPPTTVRATLLRLSPSYFEQESTGAHVSRITGDVVILQQCLGTQLAEIINAPVSIAFALVGMFYLNWQLTLTALCLAPVIAIVMSAGGTTDPQTVDSIQERLADLNAGLVERLGNVRVIQSFVREPYETERVATLNQHYFRDIMRSFFLTETISPGVEFVAYIGMVCGIIMAGVQVAHGHMSAAVLFRLSSHGAARRQPFQTPVTHQPGAPAGDGRRVAHLRPAGYRTGDQRCPGRAHRCSPRVGRITFDQVSFRYATGDSVLSDIRLEVSPGEVIALVGPSGAGKTTLVNLTPALLRSHGRTYSARWLRPARDYPRIAAPPGGHRARRKRCCSAARFMKISSTASWTRAEKK